MDLGALSLIYLSGAALFAALGGCIAYIKHRSPWKGCLLGAGLGPIGLILAARLGFGHRPMVDPGAWNSLQVLVNYQSARPMLQLTHQPHRRGR